MDDEPHAVRSTWREAIDALADAEDKTRGIVADGDGLTRLLAHRLPLIAAIPADSDLWLLKITEERFDSLLTLVDSGIPLKSFSAAIAARG